MISVKRLALPLMLTSTVLLTACSNSDGIMQQATFEVSFINVTNNQPLSPPAAMIHDNGYKAWNIGSPATVELEELAESGSPAALIASATDALNMIAASDVIPPGGSGSLTLVVDQTNNLSLTVATMLVNTNDAFTGVTGWNLSDIAVGETAQVLAPIYDAGTESNDELASTIPGPAGGGEGFNPAREASDQVTRHPGVVTQADGYTESALNESHRFDQGGVLVKVTRTL